MNGIAAIGRYLWKFFVGDTLQVLGLAAAFVIVAFVRPLLGPWDGVLAFALVMAIVWIDAWQWAKRLSR